MTKYLRVLSTPLVLYTAIIATLQYCHGVWNRWQVNCLFNSILKQTPHYWPFVRRSLHKVPVMRNVFPCHIIMKATSRMVFPRRRSLMQGFSVSWHVELYTTPHKPVLWMVCIGGIIGYWSRLWHHGCRQLALYWGVGCTDVRWYNSISMG